jgi:hypothetical protein
MSESDLSPAPDARNWSRLVFWIVLAHVGLGFLLLSPGYIRPDSVGTLAYLRSAVIDGDLLFLNEWALFRMIGDGFTFYKEVTPLGTVANHWGIGTSIFLSPFYVALHAIALMMGTAQQEAGFFGVYGDGLAWCTVLFAIAALVLAARSIEAVGGSVADAGAAIFFIWIGTPLLWYEYRYPFGTHVIGAFAVAVIVWLICARPLQRRRTQLALGVAFGLAVATRIQHGVLLIPLLFLFWRSGLGWRCVVRFAAGAVPAAAAQALTWTILYGTPWGPVFSGSNLEGSTWAPFARFTFIEVLFSSYHGLLSWSPVILLALVGLIIRARRGDTLAWTFLLMFIVTWAANSTLDRYFWGGLAFGGRRFVDLSALFAVGLFWFLRDVPRRVAFPAAFAASAWNIGLTLAAITGKLDLLRDVAPGELVRAVFAGYASVRDLPHRLGSPIVVENALSVNALALLVVLAVAGLMIVLVRRYLVLPASLLLVTAWVVILVALHAPTRERAPEDLVRYRIDSYRAARLGPLFDQRSLLREELAYYERTGRNRLGRATAAEIRQIEQLIAEVSDSGSAAEPPQR